MIKNQLYTCEVPGCNNKVAVRSKIKQGVLKGTPCCSYCKSKHDKKETKPHKSIKAFTEKNREKRKTVRSGLPTFFSEAIEELNKKPFCENCGCRINTRLFPVNNIAHILSKSKYKSVMTDKNNFLFLCTEKDHVDGQTSCHGTFDSKINGRPSMPVFKVALGKFKLFAPDVEERGAEYLIFEDELHKL